MLALLSIDYGRQLTFAGQAFGFLERGKRVRKKNKILQKGTQGVIELQEQSYDS
jgi:hypothetical protein